MRLSPTVAPRPTLPLTSFLPLPENPKVPLGKSVRVKLSYPGSDTIILQSAAKERVFLLVDRRRVLIPYRQSLSISISTG